ncbi:MAG: hypothetical protein GX757_12815 [Clostridiales bacterium]|nr:hypothetical protein [Clostridiales bacterium]
MKPKKIPLILTVLFFMLMIFLSFTARSIHNRMIPNVRVTRLTREKFQYEKSFEDGTVRTVVRSSYAVPKWMYDQDFLYVVVPGIKNGDERTFARKISLPIGSENDDYYEIAEQFYDVNRLFIIESDKEIQDGTEVYVIKN